MKIHGKILHHYLSSGAPDKEGYLYKKGEVNTSYQKRWFSLKGNLLFYRERRSERDLLGVIVLERCIVQLCDSEEHFAFSVSFYGDSEDSDGLRTYKFSAEDQASQESWVKALHSAHHGYLDLLVQDLHQQYLEAARKAGIEPVDSMSTKDKMRQFQKTYKGQGSNSVFYAANETHTLPTPPTGSKHANKRSPKLWPKHHTLGPTACVPEWAEPMEDFCQMHEYFGEEVRKLVAEWQRKRLEKVEQAEGNLIELG